MRVEAIVVAGGAGRRMGTATPKQFLLLAGTPILIHSLRGLANSGIVDRFIIVAPPDACDITHAVVEAHFAKRDYVIIGGGAERQQSVYHGLKAIRSDTDIVLVHDAARPLISPDEVRRVAAAVTEVGAATLAVPVHETVKEVEGSRITGTLDRSRLWAAQTPQGFRFDLLNQAHEAAIKDGVLGTDDTYLVERLGRTVVVVEALAPNLKITRPMDLRIAEALLSEREEWGKMD